MLFLICRSAPALSVAIWVFSFLKAAAFPLAWLYFWWLSLQNLLWWFCWIEGGRLRFNRLRSISFFVIQLSFHSCQLGALSASRRICCTWWKGTWLCNVSLMSPIFAFITVILEPLGSLHIFAIFGSILSVGGSRTGMVPAFLKYQIAAGDRSCLLYFFYPSWFVISCFLAALFQTTKMRMPHVASAAQQIFPGSVEMQLKRFKHGGKLSSKWTLSLICLPSVDLYLGVHLLGSSNPRPARFSTFLSVGSFLVLEMDIVLFSFLSQQNTRHFLLTYLSIYLWLAETSQQPICQTAWLKITPYCNHKSSLPGLNIHDSICVVCGNGVWPLVNYPPASSFCQCELSEWAV